MQLSKLAKNQISRIPSNECCRVAMLSAIIHTCGMLSFSASGKSIMLPVILKDIITQLLTTLYGIFPIEKGGKLVIEGDLTEILVDLRIFKIDGGLVLEEGINPQIIRNDCCKKHYVIGAFLGCGSLSLPKRSGYQLEFNINSEKLAQNLCSLLEKYELKAGIAVRKPGGFKLYLKHGESICDLFTFMGATNATLKLNSLMAERNLKMQVTSKFNCEMANMDRMVSASLIQQNAIKGLKEIKCKKLQQAAEFRLKYPQSNYAELGELMGVSKSTVKYRLNKLVEMYNQRD